MNFYIVCVPVPPRSNPNGRKCYTCIGLSCNQNLNCEGSEDHCVTTTGRDVDISAKIQWMNRVKNRHRSPAVRSGELYSSSDRAVGPKKWHEFWPVSLLPAVSNLCAHRLRDCFSLSDFRGTERDLEGLHLQEFLRRQHAGEKEPWNGNHLLSGRLLQQRRQHQRQPAAPGGPPHPSAHFFLRSEDNLKKIQFASLKHETFCSLQHKSVITEITPMPR